MGGFRFSLPPMWPDASLDPEELLRYLSTLPTGLKKELARGFERLQSLPNEKLESALTWVTSNIRNPEPAALAKILDIHHSDVGAVATSLTFCAVMSLSVTTMNFFSALASSEVISIASAQNLTTRFGPVFEKHKPDIEKTLAEQETTSEVLPSFTRIFWTVDLRPYYKDGKPRSFFPVGFITLLTDVDDERVTLQLSAADFSRLWRSLEAMKSRMDELQSYAAALEEKK